MSEDQKKQHTKKKKLSMISDMCHVSHFDLRSYSFAFSMKLMIIPSIFLLFLSEMRYLRWGGNYQNPKKLFLGYSFFLYRFVSWELLNTCWVIEKFIRFTADASFIGPAANLMVFELSYLKGFHFIQEKDNYQFHRIIFFALHVLNA